MRALMRWISPESLLRQLSMAPASVLWPFNYTSLPWSILLSIVVFHEAIDAISLLGAAIIVGAGLVVMGLRASPKCQPGSIAAAVLKTRKAFVLAVPGC